MPREAVCTVVKSTDSRTTLPGFKISLYSRCEIFSRLYDIFLPQFSFQCCGRNNNNGIYIICLGCCEEEKSKVAWNFACPCKCCIHFYYYDVKWLAYYLDYGNQPVSGNYRYYFLVFKQNTFLISSSQFLFLFAKPETLI